MSDVAVKTGRGGRRKRRRSAAGDRAAELYIDAVLTPNRALMNVALARAQRLLPAGGRHPLDVGRRERGRLAKRRRANARRRADSDRRRESGIEKIRAWLANLPPNIAEVYQELKRIDPKGQRRET